MRFFQGSVVLILGWLFIGCGSVDVGGNVQSDVESDEPTEYTTDYTTKFINTNDCSIVIDKEFLNICYDKSKKVAKSVGYTLDGDLVNELNIEDRPSFYEETSIESAYRAKTSDYTNSGYDRGHMAPDASFDWSEESLEATYSLANIIPQVPTVNQKMWVKAEEYEREVAVELGEVNVVNVIKYDVNPIVIGESSLSVSLGYYKMLFNESKNFEACYYYLNDTSASSTGDTLEQHQVECSSVEY